MSKPVLFVTNHAPAFRVGAFAKLHEREDVVFALIGGDVRHGGGAGATTTLPFPVLRPTQREVARLAPPATTARSSRASPAARPARRLRGRAQGPRPVRPVGALWAHPRTLPHAASYLVVRHLYRHADAIATYGPHVSAYVRSKGARQPVRSRAPQSVDNEYWIGHSPRNRRAPFQAAFVGRIAREKGPQVLIQAWSSSGLSALSAALVLVGGGPIRARAVATGAVLSVGPQSPAEVRNFYAGSDVVVLPSVPTRDFREPWGLVVNEAFNQGVPVIATDAVGAVAGGLVRHERTGLVVPAGDVEALAGALRRMYDEPELRARLGAAGREAVKAYSHDAWAAGMSKALQSARSKPLLAWKAMVRLLTLSGLILLLAAPTAMRGGPREDPARVPGGQHHRRLHARAAARRSQAHPHRHRRVLRLPRRARAGRADRPRREQRRRRPPARRAACSPRTAAAR